MASGNHQRRGGEGPIRVKMVIGQFRPITGGAEHQAEILATALCRRGVDVEVITGRPRGVPGTLADDPIRVRRLRVPGYRRVKQLLLVEAFYRTLLRFRAALDIVHVHQAQFPAYAAVRAARKLGIPSIVKCANSGPRFDLEMLAGWRPFGCSMAHHVARSATRFVALNALVGDQLREWKVSQERVVHIPNGVEIGPMRAASTHASARRKLGLDGGGFIVVGVGYLNRKKDFSALLRAFHACSTIPERHLVLVGNGPMLDQLTEEAHRAGIESRVRFAGHVEPKDVRTYLSAADVFVLPSLTEGLSNALLEAMAAGLPCIASDIPGNRGLIRDGETGMIFPVGDAEALARAIQHVYENTTLRAAISHQGRELVANCYSMASVADRYIALYESLLKRAS